jgi:peptidoglycan/LPS O-acetylase OafA/YrhL
MLTDQTLVKDKSQTLDNTYFTQLDGLRCFAVLAVLICHWVTYRFIVVIPFGSMGVNLFFVLSGFLITRILLIEKDKIENKSIIEPLKKFYIRRTLRIFPIYYLTIIFLFLINFPAARQNIIWLISYTFNLKFSIPSVWESGQLNYLVHLWSLSVEEQFYLFFPFLIFIITKSKIKISIISLIILGLLTRIVIYLIKIRYNIATPLNAIYVFTPSCFDSFGIGALLAYYLLYEPIALNKLIRNNLLFAISIFLFVITIIYSRLKIENYGECRTILERFLFSVCCFWIVGKAVTFGYQGIAKRLLENSLVIYIGKISYGIYVFHYFADPLLQRTGFLYNTFLKEINNDMLAKAFLFFILTLIISSISWKFIECPINKLKNKY